MATKPTVGVTGGGWIMKDRGSKKILDGSLIKAFRENFGRDGPIRRILWDGLRVTLEKMGIRIDDDSIHKLIDRLLERGELRRKFR